MYNQLSSFLPPSYPTWVKLYNKIKKEGLENESTISVVDGFDILWYDTEFIKARCFEELVSDDFTVDDLNYLNYILGIDLNGLDKGDLKNKLSSRIHQAHALRKFD